MSMPNDVAAYNRKLIEEFRLNGGPPEGRPLLLLTTKGARSGQPHTTPLMSIPHEDRLLVVASAAAAPKHPAWYHNVLADPRVTVETGAKPYQATAVVLTGEERDRIFAEICERYPFFVDHQAKVARKIPVVSLPQG